MGHIWQPIEPLPADWVSWADTEMPAVRVVWSDLQSELAQDASSRLHQRMMTEWSIETGMVEDLYHWDRGVTETLLVHGVRPDRIPDGASAWSPELVAQVIQDQIAAIEGLFSLVKAERPLGTSFIHELHAQLLRSAPRNFELGKWKVLPNRVQLQDGTVHEYCPPEHVASEIDRLLEWNDRYATDRVPIEIRAAWLHHRFTEIHPYPDGNGRTARALASLLLIQHGLFPLIIRRSEKHAYIDALERADRGDLQPLVARVRAMQRRELVKMGTNVPRLPAAAEPPATLEETLQRIKARLTFLERLVPEKWAALPATVDALALAATSQMESLAQRLTMEFGPGTNYKFSVVDKSSESVAGLGLRTDDFDYSPRCERMNRNICLQIALSNKWRIVAAFHETAPKSNGIAACVLFLSPPDREATRAFPVPSYFLITYAEPLQDIQLRYSAWLDTQLMQTLDQWQRLL